jgi:ABC-type branched-subunit amino acid transport system substrate-binding protein
MLPTVAGLAALEDAPYSFRTLESAKLQMEEAARLAQTLGLQKIAMVVLDDAAGQEYAAYLPEAVRANGMEYVGQEFFRADDQDLTTQVLKVQELGADGVAIGTGNSAQCAKVIAAVDNLGWGVQILGNSGLENTQLGTLVGEGIVGAKFVNTFRGYQGGLPVAQMPAGYVRHLQAVLQTENIPPPESRDLSGFGINTPVADAIFIWAEAVARANSLDSDMVKAELEQTNVPADRSPSGGNLVITPDNHEAYREGSLFFYEWRKLPNDTLGYVLMEE